MLSESLLSSILSQAAQAQAASKTPGVSLIPFLSAAIVQQLELVDLQLWQAGDDGIQSLWKTSNGDAPQQISEESLQKLTPGSVEQFDLEAGDQSTSQILSLATAALVERARVVLAIVHRAEQSIDDDLLQLVEIFADVRRRELLQSLIETTRRQHRVQSLVEQFHSASSTDAILQLLATEGALLSQADRVAIGVRSGVDGWKIETTSGTHLAAERSEEVRRLCRLMADGERGEIESDVELVIPIDPSQEWSSAKYAVVFERQAARPGTNWRTAKSLTQQASVALMLRQGQRWGRLGGRRAGSRVWSWSVAGIAIVLLLATLWIPMDFRIRAYGQAFPQQRQDIFSPEAGVVQTVHVEHGQIVEAGTVLCEIYNDDLFVLRERTREQLVTAEARLTALQTVSPRGSGGVVQTSGGLPLSVEQAELEQRITSLRKQVQLVEDQIGTLSVRAPFRGRVFHERLVEELPGRPVQQGQYLMHLASIEGPWELQLRIPENEVRHVIAARQSASDVGVTFTLETSPEVERTTRLAELSETTELDAAGSLTVPARCEIDREAIADLRLGAGVVSRIDCGTQPLAYLLTRRLLDFWARYAPF